MSATNIILLSLLLGITLIVSGANSFRCYVCDSKTDIECVENLPQNSRLVPQDCGNITDAKYCIKTTNLYAGELGTKRFCAANDHGNYCKYVKQPTGDREYRGCVLTCDIELCNKSSRLQLDPKVHLVTVLFHSFIFLLLAILYH